MDEDALNMSVRRFLKELGVTSQREIEKAVRAAVEDGTVPGKGILRIEARVTVDGLDLDHRVEGELQLG
ncbi:MAG: hypothetical protein GVY28_06210 [Alphaproteobacteria bacterium]|jgi:hypothetical protein|nr:hypothetical protein [Alphaproteobacteria bacterium]